MFNETIRGIWGMTQWKTISAYEQEDEVGNIYQIHGAVKTKACQNCKKKFENEQKKYPLIQKIPLYKCADCSFEAPSAQGALDHKLDNDDHKLEKVKKERIVAYNVKLVGNFANIIKTENDVIILCDACK